MPSKTTLKPIHTKEHTMSRNQARNVSSNEDNTVRIYHETASQEREEKLEALEKETGSSNSSK
jgi:hypothetical protein